MNTRHLLVLLLLCMGCQQQLPDDPIPLVPVNAQINLNSLLYDNLRLIGGTAYLNDAGYRGLVIYRAGQTDFRAFDRTCSYAPSQACERVSVDDSGLFLIDTCCGSSFDFFGFPSAGPASWPLLEYRTTLSGDILLISN